MSLSASAPPPPPFFGFRRRRSALRLSPPSRGLGIAFFPSPRRLPALSAPYLALGIGPAAPTLFRLPPPPLGGIAFFPSPRRLPALSAPYLALGIGPAAPYAFSASPPLSFAPTTTLAQCSYQPSLIYLQV
ncbi:hypothetical protein B0H14DRAFT_3427499 [Mycena olivaceomarginata]|nr:hypothetical protein B0H14DRAFT_3427499 [Mycena olivaceomarginata]